VAISRADAGLARIDLARARRVGTDGPHSDTAEKNVLGSLLLNASNWELAKVLDVDESDFYCQHHRSMWRAMVQLRACGRMPELITVTEHLNLGSDPEPAGGWLGYIGTLCRETLLPQNCAQYVEIIRSHAKARRLVEIGETLARPGSPPEERAARAKAALGVLDGTSPAGLGPNANAWPTLSDDALQGVVGRIVRAACENSEADPAAVLASVLAWFGTSFGSAPHLMVGDTRHFSRFFFVKVGASAKARKGTSEDPPKRIFREAERLGTLKAPLFVSPGPLSTGEGLIRAVRDPSEELDDDGQPIDAGVPDKRLLVIEGELGAPLKAAQREGNTLSAIMRTFWDSGDAAPMTKSNRIKATGAHVSMIGHITRQELTQLLRTADIWNGFANRVMWFCVRRPKQVAIPEGMSDTTVTQLASEVCEILNAAAVRDRVQWSEQAKTLWRRMYSEITAEEPGPFGAVTARAEAQIQRLALLYALIDMAPEIDTRHFMAAAAVWEYARDSARLLFEGAAEDPNVAKIRDMLTGGALTQSQINVNFSGHLKGAQLKQLLEEMQAAGIVCAQREPTSGRPVTRWALRDESAGKAEKAEKAGSTEVPAGYSAKSAYSAGDES
jgi:hypothetical protein